MKIILPSNKYVELNNILHITDISLYEFPDVYTQFWYEYNIVYENETISMSYNTEALAKIDRDFLLNVLNPI